MTTRFCARPLTLAGPAAVAGVLTARLGIGGGITLVCAALFPFLWPRRLRIAAVVFGCAFAAGVLRGAPASPPPWARAPPELARCEITVTECGEDPFSGRAWCAGTRRDRRKVSCSWPGRLPPGIAPGAVVGVAGRCYFPHPPTNPGERPRGNDTLRVDPQSASNVELVRPAPPGPRRALARLRVRLVRRLATVLPRDAASLSAALLLGVRAGIRDRDRWLFERTGTMHMLAISGLHVLLLAGVVHAALRRLGAGPRTAAGLTLLLAWTYVPLTGGAAPIRRAVTVLTFYGLALVRGRRPDAPSALAGSALLLALVSPDEVTRVGFWLSFLAVTAILFLAAGWRQRLGRRHQLLARFPAVRADRPFRIRIEGYVLRALPVAVAAWCATQGLVAHAFGTVTPLAPLINIVVAPLLSILLPLLALLAAGLDPLAGPVTAIVRLLRATLQGGAHLGCAWMIPPPPTFSLLAWFGGLALLRWRPRAAACLLAAGAAGAMLDAPPAGPSLHLLDVGHGQAALIRFDDGRVVLVDAGSRGRRRLARHVVLPALRALGVRELDAVVCTHSDADHWNALPAVLPRIPVRRLILGPSPPPHPLHPAGAIVRAHPGQVIHATKHCRLSVLGPDGRQSDNDRSLALLFEAYGARVLLPADREEAGLEALVAGGLPACDVLVAPHHGARCGNALALGLAVRPRWLLVSTRRGFADDGTLALYRGRVRRTDEQGCLRVRFAPLRVDSFLGPDPDEPNE